MNRLFLVTPLLVIAACATPRLEPVGADALQEPESLQAMESSGVESVTVESAEPENSAENFEGIKDIDAPRVSETPAEMIPQVHSGEPAIVCEREVPVGSVLPVEVCRRRADMERRQEADQRTLERIKQRTAIGASRF